MSLANQIEGAGAPEEPQQQTAENSAPPSAPENPPAEPQAAGDPWYKSIEDDSLRGIAEAKAWESPADVVRSYHELEKMKGIPADQILRKPQEGNEEQAAEFWKKLGKPNSPDEYQLSAEGVEQNEIDWIKNLAFSLNADQKGAEKVLSAMQELGSSTRDAQQQHLNNEYSKAAEELKSEWGDHYPNYMKLVAEAEESHGLNLTALVQSGAMSAKEAMKTGLQVAQVKIGSNFVEGQRSNSIGTSQESARAQLNELRSTEEYKRAVLTGQNKAILEKQANLARIATGSGLDSQ